ncbi:MAG: response regulator [Desulfobacterales bacterium]|uniref:histidine kinase n=1 Tax=Candidatus Desulfatibia profunda TaxID=2841695 RepID=A0A8J6NQQ1_9BACT|nr:response regulator [Candidatus Desulfatibia profunda]MBL7180699.1 response regulator [Desulfobacterales bacterium]
MTQSEYTAKLEDKIILLETQLKHLTNELCVTKEEYIASTQSYFDLLSTLENKVNERTKELKDLQLILEAKGRELEIMLDSSPGMIFYKDKAQRYIRVNKKFVEIVGIPMNEVIGKTHAELFPDNQGQVLDDDSEVIQKGASVLNRSGILETIEGRKSLRVDKIPYKDKDGEVIGVIGFALDLTDLEKAEKERKNLQERITRAEKMEAIGLLAGGFAHDSNNILGGVTGYIQMALMNMPADDPNRRYLKSSMDSANRMAELVQDLLTLARRGVSNTEVLNLNDVVTVYLRSSVYAKLKLYHPDVDIKTDLEPGLLNIAGKPVHLEKTVMNLVTNAAEALPNGGTVTMSTRNQYVDRPINGYDLSIQEGEFVVMEVSDNGTGIALEDLNRIFEPFYTKKVMGRSGTGLGMAVVYGTVKDHQGFINVRSVKGVGTTFELYFPVTREAVSTGKTVIPMEAYTGSGQKILVVDDVAAQREIASGILNLLGYSVVAVSSGEAAVAHMKKNAADLVILDMIMDPGIDGLDTYRKILELHPGQKAIITSGFSETDRVKECQKLGAGQYIQKPYTLEKIGMAVKNAINNEMYN